MQPIKYPILCNVKVLLVISNGRMCLPKTGWASSNAPCCCWATGPSILPTTGWAITHPAHLPVTTLSIKILRKPQENVRFVNKRTSSYIYLIVQSILRSVCILDYQLLIGQSVDNTYPLPLNTSPKFPADRGCSDNVIFL